MSRRPACSLDWSPEGTHTPRRARLQEGTPPGSDDLPTSPPIPMSPPPSYRQAMAAEEPDLGYGRRWCWRWEWRLRVVLTASPDVELPVPPSSRLGESVDDVQSQLSGEGPPPTSASRSPPPPPPRPAQLAPPPPPPLGPQSSWLETGATHAAALMHQ